MACYCAYHRYPLIRIILSEEERYEKLCPGRDFMFRRHCVLHHYLASHQDITWVLFADSDMGVINPNHLIEEYLDQDADLVFYNRIFDYEIMAGSFLVKNTEFSRKFLLKWSLYEWKVPKSFHGTDNGALHKVFLDHFCPRCAIAETRRCEKIWSESDSYTTLFMFESCVRAILGKRERFESPNGNVTVLSDPADYWARDGWLTGNKWSDRDFLLHGWQEKRRDVHGFASWNSPFQTEHFPLAQCVPDQPETGLFWHYKAFTHRAVDAIHASLTASARYSYLSHLKQLANVASYRTA